MRWLMLDSMEVKNTPFVFITGGRGIGKTYGALKFLYENGIKFLYLRRTDTQREIASNPETHPMLDVAADIDVKITTRSISKYLDEFVEYIDTTDSKGKTVREYGSRIGYITSLSCFSNVRGFSARDVKVIIYDEFIPEIHERKMKGEAAALFNLYESVNRNRELKGEEAVYLFGLSNANTINNSIYEYLGLVEKMVRLMEKPKNIWELFDHDKGYRLIHIKETPISEQKKMTALYKLTQGTDFADMAISNKFKLHGSSLVKPQPINEYICQLCVKDIYVCTHKSDKRIYVTKHGFGDPVISTLDKKFLQKNLGFVWNMAIRKSAFFEDYDTLRKFIDYLNVPKDCYEMID